MQMLSLLPLFVALSHAFVSVHSAAVPRSATPGALGYIGLQDGTSVLSATSQGLVSLASGSSGLLFQAAMAVESGGATDQFCEAQYCLWGFVSEVCMSDVTGSESADACLRFRACGLLASGTRCMELRPLPSALWYPAPAEALC